MQANGQNGQQEHQPKRTKLPAGNNYGLQQAYDLRNIAAAQVLMLNECPDDNTLASKATRARALRDLTAVWDNASERIRILRGRPLPGSLKPKQPTRKRTQRTGPLFSDDSASTPATEQGTSTTAETP